MIIVATRYTYRVFKFEFKRRFTIQLWSAAKSRISQNTILSIYFITNHHQSSLLSYKSCRFEYTNSHRSSHFILQNISCMPRKPSKFPNTCPQFHRCPTKSSEKAKEILLLRFSLNNLSIKKVNK